MQINKEYLEGIIIGLQPFIEDNTCVFVTGFKVTKMVNDYNQIWWIFDCTTPTIKGIVQYNPNGEWEESDSQGNVISVI